MSDVIFLRAISKNGGPREYHFHETVMDGAVPKKDPIAVLDFGEVCNAVMGIPNENNVEEETGLPMKAILDAHHMICFTPRREGVTPNPLLS